MKIFEIVLIGGISLYLLDKIGTAAIAKTLNFRINNIRFESGNPVIDLIAQNPQDAGFYVNSIVADVSLDNTVIGNISMFNQVFVAPLGESLIPVTFRVSLLGAIQNLLALVNGTLDKNVVVAIVGNVNVGGTLFPLNLSFKNF